MIPLGFIYKTTTNCVNGKRWDEEHKQINRENI